MFAKMQRQHTIDQRSHETEEAIAQPPSGFLSLYKRGSLRRTRRRIHHRHCSLCVFGAHCRKHRCWWESLASTRAGRARTSRLQLALSSAVLCNSVRILSYNPRKTVTCSHGNNPSPVALAIAPGGEKLHPSHQQWLFINHHVAAT